MPESGPTDITCKKILAVEGLDEKNFFDKLLKYLGVAGVQIEDVGGKNQFPDKFPALLMRPGIFAPDGAPLISHVAIVRDQDEDQALESVVKIVRDAGLSVPEDNACFSDGRPRVGVFIMPGSKIPGTMLEDLCLKSVESHPAMTCVGDFVSCVERLEAGPKNKSKARVQAFLAAQPEIASSLGVGAQKGYWDFESPALDELKRFLNNLK
ncbi:MAG: DUF3226 domain-containing protein [Planctomycetota bacterium]